MAVERPGYRPGTWDPVTSGSAGAIALHWAALVAGVLLLLGTTRAVMTSMLIPRATRSRLVHHVDRAAGRSVRWLAMRRTGFPARDRVLSYVVPVALVYLLLVFVVAYLIGFALITWAAGSDVGESLYQAGATLTTLGFAGDPNAAQVVIGLLAAVVGLALVAVLIGYLLALYGAFADRERMVATLAPLTGEPAWGPEMLCRAHLLGDATRAFGYDADAVRDWMTEIRTVQSANPLLNHMRTPIPQRSWAITLVAITDAAAVRVSAVEGGASDADAARILAEGSAALVALQASYLLRQGRAQARQGAVDASVALAGVVTDHEAVARVMRSVALDAHADAPGPPVPTASSPHAADPGLSRRDWDDALALLERCGIPLVADRDRAWHRFSIIRASYAASAEALANRVYSVRAPWTGTRTPATDEWWPHLAAGPEE